MNEQRQARISRKALLTAVTMALAAPALGHAESAFKTGGPSPSASARLDFQIVIPTVLYLRVGTGTNLADNATVDQIQFSVPAANVGDGTAINATAGSGDLGSGTVTAKVAGNNGAITFTATTLGSLGNGVGDTISYSQIATTVTTLTSATALTAPALTDGATTTVTLTPASGKVVARDAKWTYTYLNQSVAAPGTYGGVNANNSRVTYTASMP